MKCDEVIVHEDKVKKAINTIPNKENIEELTEVFKVFSDSTRIKILYTMLDGKICVCNIANILGMTQSAISHQLRILKNSRLVRCEKICKEVYYFLDDEHVLKILDLVLEHVKEKEEK